MSEWRRPITRDRWDAGRDREEEAAGRAVERVVSSVVEAVVILESDRVRV